MHPREIQLCIAIVKYRTRLKIPRRGICTSYLSALQPGMLTLSFLLNCASLLPRPYVDHWPASRIYQPPGPKNRYHMHRSRHWYRTYAIFKLKNVSYWHKPYVLQVSSISYLHPTPILSGNTLYFGCRSASKDQHYGQEWKAYAKENKLVYRVACSRDGPEGVKRTYVQDLIEADGERIWELISRGAWVYISGYEGLLASSSASLIHGASGFRSSNKMPASGERCPFGVSVVSYGGLSTDEAGEYVKRMELEGKLMEECWS